jgi:hypothetical protein
VKRRVTASEHHPKGNGLPPLRLGTRDGRQTIEALMNLADPPQAVLRITSMSGTAQLTKRGADHLANWLREWARPQSHIKLVGPAEIIKEHKISSRTLANWRKHPAFPKKLADLAQGPVWERDAVRTWVKLDRPGRGRPVKQ